MIEELPRDEVLKQEEVLVYKNPHLPVKSRVIDLLSRMTLREKIAQMLCIWGQKREILFDAEGNFDLSRVELHLKDGIGQIARLSDCNGGLNAEESVALANTIQKFFTEETRLGIPVIFHEECLHGLAAKEATSYPQPIGLASTFDPELVEEIYTAIAEETRSRGAHQALTPVVDVAREPRWGRVEETFGEDPYLVAQMGIAAVKGFQGDGTFKDKKRIIATLKHFAAHGQPESGMNCGPVNVSERLLRDTFLYPFKEAIKKGKAKSVMASYNEIDGVPSHANTWLLRNVLRGEWGFEGYVVSDYYAIAELHERDDVLSHRIAADKNEAASLAVAAGVNIELPDPDCYPRLIQLAEEGTIKESAIDELVAPLLRYKFEMGLFEDPYVKPELIHENGKLEHDRALALRAARETITLLKNDGSVLPLDPGRYKTIAVIGPNADRVLLGGYSGTPKYYTTLLQGIKEKVGKKCTVLYNEGCKITIGGSWNDDTVTFPDSEDDRKLIKQAVATALQADVVVLALGGNEQTSREAWNKNHMGDRADLELIGMQNELVKAIAETGKPIAAMLFNGRPNSINRLNAHVSAILECWYLGQETGAAAADVLFGDYNPGGKLPISFPRSAGHLPCYYNYKPSARRGYLHDAVSPLFPFGYGLSYTTFACTNLRLEKEVIRPDESTKMWVDVENTGARAGEEVIQMYIRDLVSSVTRPVKELKGFKRIFLKPGEKQTIALPITPEHLAFTDIHMKNVVEPGDFHISGGSSSRDEDLLTVVLHVV
ncbi:MAG: glycoside hydrolase family 3 C-terminal domain-containing protein [Bacteroidota bacterium]|nr:glycoside hydrolase family 3 C-terminal domain-containing protein [Bacteroidota bacterium]